jgi:hypothetical protein
MNNFSKLTINNYFSFMSIYMPPNCLCLVCALNYKRISLFHKPNSLRNFKSELNSHVDPNVFVSEIQVHLNVYIRKNKIVV